MSDQDDRIDPVRLCKAQQAEFTRLYRAMGNITERLERMNLRLQNVERVKMSRQERQVSGRNRMQEPKIEDPLARAKEVIRRARVDEEERRARVAEEERQARVAEEERRARVAEEERRARVAEEERRARVAEEERRVRVAEEERRARVEEEKRIAIIREQEEKQEKAIEEGSKAIKYSNPIIQNDDCMPIEHMEFILPHNDFVVYEVQFQILHMDNISQVVEKRFQSCGFFLLLQHYKTRGRVFSNKGGMIESSQGCMEYYKIFNASWPKLLDVYF